MAFSPTASQTPTNRANTLIMITLTGVIGFLVGQNWPTGLSSTLNDGNTVVEDWHGNVMRSYWSE